MRILVRQLHRAFKELDSYSDEQCLRFITAANRWNWTKLLRWLVLFIAGFIAIIAGAMLAGMAYAALQTYTRSWREPTQVLLGVPTFMGIMVPVFALVLILRDFLLRRRIKFVIRDRGSCASCGYSLIGLTVNPSSCIICPECGIQCEVDASLSELTITRAGPAGDHATTPAPTSPPNTADAPINLEEHILRVKDADKRRRKRGKRILKWIAIVILAIGVMLSCYELFIRSQAAQARRERPTAAQFESLFIQRNGPLVAAPPGSTARAVALRLIDMRNAVDAAPPWGTQTPEYEDRSPIPFVDVGIVCIRPPPTPDPLTGVVQSRDYRRHMAEVGYAKQLLSAYRAAGMWEAFDEFTAAPLDLPPDLASGVSPSINTFPDYLGHFRRLARINDARMHLAIVVDDPEEFRRALAATMRLADVTASGPLAIENLVALSIEQSGCTQIQAALRANPTPQWTAAIRSAAWSRLTRVEKPGILEGDRLVAIDFLASIFSETSKTRFGNWSAFNSQELQKQDLAPWKLGTFQSNRDAVNASFAAAETRLLTDPFARPPTAAPLPLPTPASYLTNGIDGLIASFDRARTARGIVAMWILIEEYRHVHGTYPPSLAAAAPAQLSRFAIDPWTGTPFTYNLLNANIVSRQPSFQLLGSGLLIDTTDDRNPPSPAVTTESPTPLNDPSAVPGMLSH